jgi:peptidoglycan/xylan/chitin deacetylase (PgdA/CDA1 family)
MPVALVLLLAFIGFNAISVYTSDFFLEPRLPADKEVNILTEVNNQQAKKQKKGQEDFAREVSALKAELEQMPGLKKTYAGLDSDPEKVIYLTFDDGPSASVTNDILDVLDYYGIKATFFVIGARALAYPEVVRRIHAAGHAIGNHTYNHNYKSIYRNLDTFTKDFQAAQEAIFSVTGEYPRLYRYAGGSLTARNYAGRSTRKQFDQYLWQQGIQYFDWNIDSGDARGGKVTVDSITGQTIRQLKTRQKAIILMHDFKYRQSTAKALPGIIETLLEKGYVFSTLSPSGYTVQH